MKIPFTKGIIVLFIITTGFELSLYSQCVSEENVYSFMYLGKKYEIVKELKNWSDAADCAAERGGYLAEIDTQEEQDTIYGAILYGAEVPVDYTIVNDGGGIAYVWIGASDQHTEGTWLWDGDGDSNGINFWNGQGAAGLNDGTPVEEMYNNWGGSSSGTPNEPDDYLSKQDGAAIGLAKWPAGIAFTLGIASEWNDISADNTIYFVIEFDCHETTSTLDETACGSYISPSGKIWTSSDTYLDTIVNAAGCDSVITINLTIVTVETSSLDETACGSYISPSGKIWITSDTYQDTVLNAAGCDSVITINLTIVTVDTSVVQSDKTLSAGATGLEYQWLDCDQENTEVDGETNQSFTATSNGNYAVEITDGMCTDTSECFAITTVQVIERSFIDQLNIYQSTDRNIFHVDLGKEYKEVIIKVADVNGRIVKNRTFIQSQLLNIELDKPPGIYLFKVNAGTKQAVIKIIKN